MLIVTVIIMTVRGLELSTATFGPREENLDLEHNPSHRTHALPFLTKGT